MWSAASSASSVTCEQRKIPDLLRERDAAADVVSTPSRPLAPLRAQDFSDDEERILRGFTFLSIKPMLVVLNIAENSLAEEPFTQESWTPWKDRPGVALTHVCATLEGELAQLDGADAEAFMEDLGIAEKAVDRVIRESYRLLGLISFFTVGEDECRAWSIRDQTPAVEAGGVIHSDIQRGFIRAEVVPFDELVDAASLADLPTKGNPASRRQDLCRAGWRGGSLSVQRVTRRQEKFGIRNSDFGIIIAPSPLAERVECFGGS